MDLNGAVEDIIPWDGTLSSSEFFLSARTFSEKWKMFNPSFPPWQWILCPKQHLVASHKVEGYLSMENMCHIKSSEEEDCIRSLTWKEDSNDLQREEPVDCGTLVCPEHEVNHYDFHIVYSSSYRVPVLYFRSYHSDGQLLSFNEIEKDLPCNSAKLLSESKWTFITNEEHPHLNRPWYKLHPCGTSEWMKLLFDGDSSLNRNGLVIERYLVSWFSVIGQVVGLKIPLEMLDTVVSNDS
ncbi:ubiquitin-like-conjugating enzyme ATG10 isoform X1 [Vigna umbellata]|uniref:ubiquitin-like-conjugating enzyme ATG10 isoform X1 n=1 Tax=Vigna umbellata TaxID=87088 RepID=UPI001F5F2F9E|nr:ubiquitin-like-conjugating enzyme ATG10 isoform X1 [Vigna umbellata]XP_047172369.1 ubiquitin-like-conjugating enzyme ATG10 isoform X1 [Vigna umbellata]XP_047172370.1 ubiquitin-like-conjugating enzyme ATG10 isoform X1 [Vigna umbellata]XP_047172371.1 ubiquitin-like-conjugating enzyme ATG10 isoform X1 [Vigna umbellata]